MPAQLVDAQIAQGWHGSLDLTLNHQAGKTVPFWSKTAAPLRLQRPFYPEGDAVCHSVIVHTAGGIVGGDRLTLALKLEPHSRALVTTAAANKVYRSSGAIASQSTTLQLAAQTTMEWFPQETIVFNGANFQQSLRVDLTDSAIWLGWDITRFGRSARGEQFIKGRWRSDTEVWQGNHPIWIDRQQLEGGSDGLTSPHGLGGYPVIGSFALIGCPAEAAWIEQARHLGDRLNLSQTGDFGVTALINGLLCRYRGTASQSARRWFIKVWQDLRPFCLNRTACQSRIWGI